jgi:hypothetical protein
VNAFKPLAGAAETAIHTMAEGGALEKAAQALSREATAPRPASELAAKAAERIRDWYPTLPPRLGTQLADPNVVLTLADARSQTEWVAYRPQPGDKETWKKFGASIKSSGFLLSAHDGGSHALNAPALSVSILNLPALEPATAVTELPGVARFVNGGVNSRSEWYLATMNGLASAQKNKLYPAEAKKIELVRIGVEKGYPDSAIMALLTQPRSSLAHTDVPYSKYFDCAQPNYSYDPRDGSKIEPHVNYWGSVLKNYYTSAEFQVLERRPEFLVPRIETINMQAVDAAIRGWNKRSQAIIFEKAMPILEKIPRDHPVVSETVQRYAALLREMKNPKEAESLEARFIN